MSATFEEMLEVYCYAICTVGPGGKSVEAAKAALLKYEADRREKMSETQQRLELIGFQCHDPDCVDREVPFINPDDYEKTERDGNPICRDCGEVGSYIGYWTVEDLPKLWAESRQRHNRLTAKLQEKEAELAETQQRLVEVLLKQAVNETAETRRRLLESENIPAEIWEMRLK